MADEDDPPAEPPNWPRCYDNWDKASCGARSERGYRCTLDAHHPGDHAALGGFSRRDATDATPAPRHVFQRWKQTAKEKERWN